MLVLVLSVVDVVVEVVVEVGTSSFAACLESFNR